jgi:hypothetical protein
MSGSIATQKETRREAGSLSRFAENDYVALRLTQTSRPSPEPNNQIAAGTGTVVTAMPMDMKLRPKSPLNALLSAT